MHWRSHPALELFAWPFRPKYGIDLMPRWRGRPCRWQPTQTTNPKTKQAFTEDAAWEFIAEAIASGTPIEEIVLEKPAGKKAYVLKLAGVSESTVYVKLQLMGDHVRGRSFHTSDVIERHKDLTKLGKANA